MKRETKTVEQREYKVGLIWWVGWVVTIPLRLIVLLVFALPISASPTMFFGLLHYPKLEKDQKKWAGFFGCFDKEEDKEEKEEQE